MLYFGLGSAGVTRAQMPSFFLLGWLLIALVLCASTAVLLALAWHRRSVSTPPSERRLRDSFAHSVARLFPSLSSGSSSRSPRSLLTPSRHRIRGYSGWRGLLLGQHTLSVAPPSGNYQRARPRSARIVPSGDTRMSKGGLAGNSAAVRLLTTPPVLLLAVAAFSPAVQLQAHQHHQAPHHSVARRLRFSPEQSHLQQPLLPATVANHSMLLDDSVVAGFPLSQPARRRDVSATSRATRLAGGTAENFSSSSSGSSTQSAASNLDLSLSSVAPNGGLYYSTDGSALDDSTAAHGGALNESLSFRGANAGSGKHRKSGATSCVSRGFFWCNYSLL